VIVAFPRLVDRQHQAGVLTKPQSLARPACKDGEHGELRSVCRDRPRLKPCRSLLGRDGLGHLSPATTACAIAGPRARKAAHGCHASHQSSPSRLSRSPAMLADSRPLSAERSRAPGRHVGDMPPALTQKGLEQWQGHRRRRRMRLAASAGSES
jgi:hypothetical protein